MDLRRFAVLTSLGLVLVGPGAAEPSRADEAKGPAPAGADLAPLSDVVDGDPLQLARLVDRHGDRLVLLGLASEQPGQVRFVAARAAPYMEMPWSALELLCELMLSRDSELAPAAARSVLAIAQETDADALWANEVMPGELAGALKLLRSARERAELRADIRLMAGQAASMLQSAGVTVPVPKKKSSDAQAQAEK